MRLQCYVFKSVMETQVIVISFFFVFTLQSFKRLGIHFFFFLSDFAVGAPYDDEGVGNVYIYHGSETGLSSTKASQVF